MRVVGEPVTQAMVDAEFAASSDRLSLFLLCEHDPKTKVRPGVQALGVRVLDRLVAENGPLDDALRSFAAQRKSTVHYARLAIDRNSPVMASLGVVWLPQVRVMRGQSIVFRSSVVVSQAGFLVEDVGGQSYKRRAGSSGLLLDALDAEVESFNKNRRRA